MNFLAAIFLTGFTVIFLALLGTFVIGGIDRLIKADWARALETPMRLFSRLLYPTSAVLFVCFAFLAPHFLAAARIEGEDGWFRNAYVSFPFFLVRALLYLGVWFRISRALRLGTLRNGAGTLLAVFFTGSFAVFDWVMMLEPTWSSSVFGLTLLMSGFLIAYNLGIENRFREPQRPKEKLLVDWNTLQLALVAVWTYLAVMQWITVWEANLPRESHYYVKRAHGVWLVIIVVVAIVQSALPIFFLVFRRLKKSFPFTRLLVRATLAAQLAYLFWVVAPAILSGGSP